MSYLYVRIIEATGLAAADVNGFADPFCKVFFENVSEISAGEKSKTKFVKKEIDPLWNHQFELELAENDLAEGVMRIDVKDHDHVQNDHMATTTFSLKYFLSRNRYEGWLPLEFRARPKTTSRQKESQRQLAAVVARAKSTAVTPATLEATEEKDLDLGVSSDDEKEQILRADSVTVGAGTKENRRNDTARLYVVVAFDKIRAFGGISSSELAERALTQTRLVPQEEKDEPPIEVFCGTFNGGNVPPPDDLSPWIRPGADLYVIGLQESKYEISGVGPDGRALTCDRDWRFRIQECLGDDYLPLHSHMMMEIRMFVFIRDEHRDRISAVCSDHEATGIAHLLGNKGGVATSLEFDGTSMCFVSAHLAAHQSHLQRRNEDYQEICSNIKVGWRKQELLGQFHHIFWMGDLNYRIDFQGIDSSLHTQSVWVNIENEPTEEQFAEFKRAIEGNMIAEMVSGDQLLKAIAENEAFVGFTEPEITFKPTFKVEREPGLNYKSKRLPAYCDRVLVRNAPGYEIECVEYNSVEEIAVSDHKPVFCRWRVPCWKRACGIDDTLGGATLRFRSMFGANLLVSDVVSDSSDPYLHFPRQLLLKQHVAFKQVYKTLNPAWPDKKLKPLPLQRYSLPFLRNALLMFQVRDHDRIGSNDTIGFATLPLKMATEAPGQWTDFEILLTLKGKPAGSVRGQCCLELHPR